MNTKLKFTKLSKGVVADRFAGYEGKEVCVTVRSEIGQQPAELNAVYLAAKPAGRVYFFEFETGGRKRLIQTDGVLEMREV